MDLWDQVYIMRDQVYIMSYLVPQDQIGTLGLSPNHSISSVWGQPQRSKMDLWDQVYIMSYLVPEDQIGTMGLSDEVPAINQSTKNCAWSAPGLGTYMGIPSAVRLVWLVGWGVW